MEKTFLVLLALGVLLQERAQAQTPRFTFAASNYHPPADQATVVQSPGLDEGEPSVCVYYPNLLSPRQQPAVTQATLVGSYALRATTLLGKEREVCQYFGAE